VLVSLDGGGIFFGETKMKKHNFYLIKFSNGLVKVGIGNVPSRIATHKSTASIFDVHLEKEFTDNVTNPRLVEQYMIKHLGANCSGIRAKEWFKDADYDNALAYFETIKDAAEFAVKPRPSAEAVFVGVVQHFCNETTATDLKKRIEHFEAAVLLQYPEIVSSEIYKAVKNDANCCRWALFCALFSMEIQERYKEDGETNDWDKEILTELRSEDPSFAHHLIDEAILYIKEAQN
jgi:hypothetical protein